MRKHLIGNGLHGFITGIGVQYIAAIAVSLRLQLGYLLPYPATFAERFGGEMEAVLVTTAACGLLGAAVSIGLAMRSKPNRVNTRRTSSASKPRKINHEFTN